MPLILAMPETGNSYSQRKDSIRGPRDALNPLRGHDICPSSFTKAKIDVSYIYWLLPCPLASGYSFKHKKIAPVIMVFRVYNYIKANLVHLYHQHTVIGQAPPAIQIVPLSELNPAVTITSEWEGQEMQR